MARLTLIALFAFSSVSIAQETGGAYLGVTASALGQTDHPAPKGVTAGVVLTHVTKGSAAHNAGLREGDIIVFFDGKSIASLEELVERINKRKPGDKVTYKVHRGTGSIEGTLRLGKRPPPEEELIAEQAEATAKGRKAGRDDLDSRLDRVAREIEEMRKRLGKDPRSAQKAAPRNVIGWIELEEKRAKAAERKGDAEGVTFHRIRLTVLREMHAAHVRTTERIARIEEKLDAILEILRKRK